VLLGGNPMKLPRYQPFTDPGATVNDNYYSPSSFTITVDASKVIHHKPGIYYVYYNTSDGSGNPANEVKRLVEVLDVTTGMKENVNQTGIRVFPNPVDQGIINIQLDGTLIKRVIISDVLGKTVHQSLHTGSQVQLDISALQKGIYLIMVENNNLNYFIQKISID